MVRQVSRDARNFVSVPAGSHAGNAVPTRQSNVTVQTSSGIGNRRKLAASSLSEAQLHSNSLHERDRAVAEAASSELWALFLEVASSGFHWHEYSLPSGDTKEQFAAMFFDDMCTIVVTTLQAAIRLARHWRARCQDSNISPWTPSCIQVALWLRSLRERGPTAPHGAYSSLKWLENKIGINFHASNLRVRDQAAVPSSRVESQAKPLSLAFIVGLEKLVSSKNEVLSALALTWVVLIIAVLRFARVQRAKII